MKKCVEITVDTDTGEVSVVECDPREEGMDDESGSVQTFSSVDEGLQAAASILSGEPSEDDAMQAARRGYGSKPRIGNRPSVGQVFGED